MIENKFPYSLEAGIKHFVVWSLNKYLSFGDAYEIVERKFPRINFDVLMFENSAARKSTKSIPHMHVFIRKKLQT